MKLLCKLFGHKWDFYGYLSKDELTFICTRCKAWKDGIKYEEITV